MEDLAAAAGATSPPLAWPGKTWTSGADAEATHPLTPTPSTTTTMTTAMAKATTVTGGRDLALALAQPHPHPRAGEGDRDASPPSASWRLALDVETFDGLVRSIGTDEYHSA